MTKKSAEFFGASLRSAWDEVGSYISDYEGNLDALSADIKLLEKRLLQSGARLETEVEVRSWDEVDYIGDDGRSRQPGDGYRVELRHASYLYWGPNDEGKWRLWLRTDTDLDVSEDRRSEFRPVIELPVADRIKAGQRLGELLRLVAERIRIDALDRPQADNLRALRSVRDPEPDHE